MLVTCCNIELHAHTPLKTWVPTASCCCRYPRSVTFTAGDRTLEQWIDSSVEEEGEFLVEAVVDEEQRGKVV